MPQPDNRREQGAVTRGSQQQVAPRGQASANISPITGGAVSPGPDVRIGVQAQIADSGTALYEAISGVSRGIQQGIENYEKMYRLQSEKDYAEFETQYVQESERVKNDPSKLKGWMESQTYKPNRITARRYNSLKADINGKAYEDEQEDQWLSHLRKTSEMTSQQALEYYNDTLDRYDPSDYVYKEIEKTIIGLQGKVAADARKTNIGLAEEDFYLDNYRIIEYLHTIGYDDLSGPAMEKILTASSLGLVTINSGVIVDLSDNKTYTPNDLLQEENFLDSLTARIGDKASELGADYVGAAMKASRLPASITRSSTGPDSPIDPSIIYADARDAVVKNKAADLRRQIGNLPATSDGSPTNDLDKLVNYVLRANEADPTVFNPQEQLRQITLLLDTITDEASLTDGEGNRPLLDRLGYDKDFDVYLKQIEGTRLVLEKKREDLIFKMIDSSMLRYKQGVDIALNEQQLRQISRETAIELGSALSQTGRKAIFHVIDGKDDYRSLTLEEVRNLPSSSILAGVEIVDPTLSSDVPFLTINRDSSSGFIFTGSGSDKISIGLRDQLDKIKRSTEEIFFSESLLNGTNLATLTQNQQRIGFNKIVKVDPFAAIGVLASTKSPYRLLDTSNEEVSEILKQAVSPESISQMSQKQRQLLNVVAASNTEFVSIMGQDNPEIEALYRYSGLAPEGTTDWSTWALETARAMSDPRITEYASAAETLTGQLILEDGEDTADIVGMADLSQSTDPLSDKQNKERNLLRGLDRNYSNHYVDQESIFIDLVSDNDTVRLSAQEFVREYLRKAPSLSNLLREGSIDSIIDVGSLISDGNIPVSHTPRNANDLYGPEQNSTAETQGGLVFLDWFTKNRGDRIQGLFKAVGIQDGINTVDRLKENPEAMEKLTTLFASIKYIPVPRSSVVSGRDKFGLYEEYEYRLDMSNINLEDETFQKEIRELNDRRLTITRRFYRTRSSDFEKRRSGTQLLPNDNPPPRSPPDFIFDPDFGPPN